MEPEYCVYLHIGPSGKVYIGVTKNKPEVRWQNGLGYRGNEYFSNAICRHGWDRFQHKIIAEGLSREDAENMEIDLIAIHDATNRDCGYNLEHGGNVCVHSEESRRKMSIAHMGNNHCTGRKLSPETKQKISIANMGKKSHAGHKASLESRVRMSKAHMGQKVSLETRAAMSKTHIGKKLSPEICAARVGARVGEKRSERARLRMSENSSVKRAVEQIDGNGNVIARFCSLIDAASSVNACSSHIGKVCRGISKTHKGYKWRYCNATI